MVNPTIQPTVRGLQRWWAQSQAGGRPELSGMESKRSRGRPHRPWITFYFSFLALGGRAFAGGLLQLLVLRFGLLEDGDVGAGDSSSGLPLKSVDVLRANIAQS
jgi:hypothetical protein